MRRTSTPLQKYIKKTGRYLICSKETKQHMLDGLYKEMLESNSPFSDEGQIVSIYGTPKDFADSLMQGVKSSEKEQVLQHRKHLFRCGINCPDTMHCTRNIRIRMKPQSIVHTCEDALEKGTITSNKLRSLEEMYDEYIDVFHGNGYVKTLMTRVRKEVKIND